MSHKSAKAIRKHVRGAKQQIVDSVLRQLRGMSWWQRAVFAWRLIDQSPRIGCSWTPLYAYIERSGHWGFILQFKRAWWDLDRAPADTRQQSRRGWSLTILGVRIDWRREL